MKRLIDTFKNDDGTITCPGCSRILEKGELIAHFEQNPECCAAVGGIMFLETGKFPTEQDEKCK